MTTLSKRLVLGGVAVAAALLTAGGVAYAVGDEPAPQTGFVEVVDDPNRDCPDQNDNTDASGEL